MILSINKVESDLKALWRKWSKNALRIWKQSPIMMLILVISQIVFGLLPYLITGWFGELVDTTQGARSLGLWTDSMGDMMWMWLGLMLLVFVSSYLTRQFRGASASVARGIRWIVFIISLLIMMLPVAPVVIALIGLLLIAEVWIEKRLRALIWLIVSICLAWLYWNFAESVVFNVFTIGQGLTYAGLLCIIPARQFINRYFVCG